MPVYKWEASDLRKRVTTYRKGTELLGTREEITFDCPKANIDLDYTYIGC